MAIILEHMSQKQIKRLLDGDTSVLKEKGRGKAKAAHEPVFDSADWLADIFKTILGITPLFEDEWRAHGCPRDIPVREFHFHRRPKRPGPRIDLAYPYELLAVECDGGTRMGRDGSTPIGGAHNTDKDRDRNNLLAACGWRRISFTPAKMKKEPDDVLEQIMAARFPQAQEYGLPDGD